MHKKTYSTKSIVEAGLISALIFVIFLISAYTSMLSSIGTFILPIPVTILYYRHEFKIAILSVIVSFILVSLMYNVFWALIASFTFGLIGISFGYCIKNNVSKKITIITLTIANIIAYIFQMFILLSFIFKQSLVKQMQLSVNMFNESVDLSIKLYETLGMTQEQLQSLELFRDLFTVDFILKLIPVSILMYAIFSAIINYTLTKTVFSKLKYKSLEKFNQIQYFFVSNIVTGILIISWLSSNLLNHFNIAFGGYIETSILFTMQTLFMFNGFALIIYLLRVRFKKRVSKPIVILIGFLVFSTPVFARTIFFMGLIESIIDLRRLDPYSVRKNKVGE